MNIAPSGVYVNGHLVADKHHQPLSVIQDPHTAERLYVYPNGRVYYREPLRVTGDKPDVDRLNQALADQRAHDAQLIMINDLKVLAFSTFVTVAIIGFIGLGMVLG